MADAQGAAGRGARRVAPGAREEASDLVVVEDAAVAVVGDSYLVGRLDLAHHLAQDRPHFQSQSVPPSACRTFRPGASGSG